MLVISVCLVIGQLSLALLVHEEDPLLPLRVVPRDAYADVGNDGGVP